MPEVFIHHDLHPEDGAMLQALYSRSPASVTSHLEKVRAQGSGKFMASYYVGYGHASIGDCGSTSLFIENVSMLVAKAIQDNPLYSGQEVSTRYVDFSTQAFIDPYNSAASNAILEGWRQLYLTLLPEIIAALKQQHPLTSAYKSEKIWDNAIRARAYDVLRGLLPVGASTSLAWHTNLRQLRDNLRRLHNHPLPEVRHTAQIIFTQAQKLYPHSFNGEELSGTPRYAARDEYARTIADHYLTNVELTDHERTQVVAGKLLVDDRCFDISTLNAQEQNTLANRPEQAPLPRRLLRYGTYTFTFTLDFGSFRDLQRHRNGLCPIPLVTDAIGLLPWYRQQLIDLLPSRAAAIQDTITSLIAQAARLPDPLLNQYYYPMGMALLCQTTYSLPETIYVGELRSAQTVHPTLRVVAQEMLKALRNRHPNLQLYGDMSSDSWSAKRGEHTITAKAV